jgi:hypothetical protein
MAEAVSMRKVVGVIWFLAALVGIIAAFVVQPFSDWGIFAIFLALVLALLGLAGLWSAASGKGRLFGGNTSRRTNMIISVLGLIGATIAALAYLIGDWANWTATDVLSIAVWVALAAMFIDAIGVLRKQSA